MQTVRVCDIRSQIRADDAMSDDSTQAVVAGEAPQEPGNAAAQVSAAAHETKSAAVMAADDAGEEPVKISMEAEEVADAAKPAEADTDMNGTADQETEAPAAGIQPSEQNGKTEEDRAPAKEDRDGKEGRSERRDRDRDHGRSRDKDRREKDRKERHRDRDEKDSRRDRDDRKRSDRDRETTTRKRDRERERSATRDRDRTGTGTETVTGQRPTGGTRRSGLLSTAQGPRSARDGTAPGLQAHLPGPPFDVLWHYLATCCVTRIPIVCPLNSAMMRIPSLELQVCANP